MDDRRRGPVFSARDGEALTAGQAQRQFKLWLRRAGIRGRYSPGILRQTSALRQPQPTGDVLVVKGTRRRQAITSTMGCAWAPTECVWPIVVA